MTSERGEPRVGNERGSEAVADRKFDEAKRAASTLPPHARGVLVVEDDPDLQWRIARSLTVRGNRVVGTSSGEAALELMAEWPVDLVIVDDGLPGMSGLELAREIRARHPGIPVVLMSSDEENEHSRIAARLAGAVAVMVKPFRLENLLELVSSVAAFEPEPLPAE